jgi:hypothetical protein
MVGLLAEIAPGDAQKAAKTQALGNVVFWAQLGPAENSQSAAEAFEELFTWVGREGLNELTEDENTSIALQAAWETHKKAVKRDPPIRHRTEWGFDEKAIREFLGVLAKRIEAEPPDWWQATLVKGDVFPERHHAFIGLAERLPTRPEIIVQKDEVLVTTGRQSIRIARASYERAMSVPDVRTASAALWGAKQSFFACPTDRGYPFNAVCVDSKTGKQRWTASVWAARRGFSSGPPGRHLVEIRREGDTVIVYGCESHGMYAEGFDVETGKCRFRFCTCYWFNFSEAWALK